MCLVDHVTLPVLHLLPQKECRHSRTQTVSSSGKCLLLPCKKARLHFNIISGENGLLQWSQLPVSPGVNKTIEFYSSKVADLLILVNKMAGARETLTYQLLPISGETVGQRPGWDGRCRHNPRGLFSLCHKIHTGTLHQLLSTWWLFISYFKTKCETVLY